MGVSDQPRAWIHEIYMSRAIILSMYKRTGLRLHRRLHRRHPVRQRVAPEVAAEEDGLGEAAPVLAWLVDVIGWGVILFLFLFSFFLCGGGGGRG